MARFGRNGRKRLLLGLVAAAVVATALNAFVASNTVPGTQVGAGAGTISGYAVSGVSYSLNSTNPANVDAVSFTLDASASTVRVKLESGSSTYYPAANCTNTAGNDWTCSTTAPTQATVAAADQLSVVAVS